MNPFHDVESRLLDTIGSIAASPRRRRAMHEELLAHLAASYGEELARLGDERFAAEAAARRLGDLGVLGRQLEETVPYIERLLFQSLSRKENTMSRWFWILAVVAFFVGPALIMPALANHRDGADLSSVAGFLSIGILITLASIVMFAYGITRRYARPA